MLLLLFVVVGSSRRNPNTRKQVVVCTLSKNYMQHVASLGKYCCCGHQFARFVHRGVGSSPRVMVQHARVVVGAVLPWYHP